MVRNRAGQDGNDKVTGLSPRWSKVVRTYVSGALDFLLPLVCVSCESLLAERDEGIVCGLCWSRLPLLPSPRCERCGHPTRSATCQWCALLPPFVRAVRSVCWMPVEPASSIVHALKYGGWKRVAKAMGERMSRVPWPRDVVEERAAIVPVPLAPSRARERGYNQSTLLGEELAERWRIPIWRDILGRSRSTRSQTELTPEQRAANVAGSFQLRDQGRDIIRGHHLILVDDVVTTAATLNECARVLYTGGARIISYVTFGRARSSSDRL